MKKKKEEVKPVVARVNVYCNHDWPNDGFFVKARICKRCGVKWRRNPNRDNCFIGEDQPKTIIGRLETQEEADKKGVLVTWSRLKNIYPWP